MDVHQVAPWVSIVASVLSLAYVGLREWRRRSYEVDESPPGARSPPDVARLVARADVFLLTTVSMLFAAALVHFLSTGTDAAFLVAPVWLVASFVIVTTALVQSMPGETFDEKVDALTDRAGIADERDVGTDDR